MKETNTNTAALERMEQRTQEIVAAIRGDLETNDATLRAIQDEIDEAQAAIDNALATGDEALYMAANSRLSEAQQRRQFYTGAETRLKTGALITPDEYENTRGEVIEDFKARRGARAIRLEKILIELDEIRAEHQQDTERVNNALKAWQQHVYRYADLPKSKTGQPIMFRPYSIPDDGLHYALNQMTAIGHTYQQLIKK